MVMRSIGIVRKVDHLGRIVLPKELRDMMNLRPHDGVEIFVDEDAIVLKKYNPSCVFAEGWSVSWISAGRLSVSPVWRKPVIIFRDRWCKAHFSLGFASKAFVEEAFFILKR